MHDPTLHKLLERVKELTALHRTARLLQDDERSETEVMRDIVHLLPAAWQYPEITAARIRFQDLILTTEEFSETAWMQTARFETQSGMAGLIEIAYLEDRPTEAEGPFLREERDLIDSLADMLRSYFQRKQAECDVQAVNRSLERQVFERTEELRRINAQLQAEVAQHREARQQIEEYENQLRALATELSLTDARERREIAADLHDRVLQEFALIKLRILQFRGDAIFCGFQRNLEEIIALLENSIQRSRELMFEISTPILYELGLRAALEWLAEHYTRRFGLPVAIALNDSPHVVSEAINVTLFKCVQELLTNAVKYAKAAHVTLHMSSANGRLEIIVADDGAGFDPAQIETITGTHRHFGLFSIRERLRSFGGSMTLNSQPGRGTSVTLRVPMET